MKFITAWSNNYSEIYLLNTNLIEVISVKKYAGGEFHIEAKTKLKNSNSLEGKTFTLTHSPIKTSDLATDAFFKIKTELNEVNSDL